MKVSSDPGLYVKVSFLGYNFMLSTKIFYIKSLQRAVSLKSSDQTIDLIFQISFSSVVSS